MILIRETNGKRSKSIYESSDVGYVTGGGSSGEIRWFRSQEVKNKTKEKLTTLVMYY